MINLEIATIKICNNTVIHVEVTMNGETLSIICYPRSGDPTIMDYKTQKFFDIVEERSAIITWLLDVKR